MNIKQIQSQIADHLGIEILSIKFQKMSDDSRLYAKEGYVAINVKYQNNELEITKSIAHEYRHAFQIYYARLMNDDRARRWKEELGIAKNGDTPGYLGQELELDAFAFTKWYLGKYMAIDVVHPNEMYERVICVYIKKYEEIM